MHVMFVFQNSRAAMKNAEKKTVMKRQRSYEIITENYFLSATKIYHFS